MRYASILLVAMFVLIGLTGCMNNSRYQTQWSSMGQTQYSRAQSIEICKLEANAAKSRGESNYRDSQKQRTLNCYGDGSTRSYSSTVQCSESVTTPTYGRGAKGVLGGALQAWMEIDSGKEAYNREMQRCMAHYGWRKEKVCVSNCGKSSSRVTNYGNNSVSGTQKEYYDTGQLQMKCNYKGNRNSGYCETYYKNGQIQIKSYVKNGKLEGLYKVYNKNGNLTYKGDFKGGEPEGPFEGYYDNGQLKVSGSAKDGKKYGIFKYYNNHGQLIRKENH